MVGGKSFLQLLHKTPIHLSRSRSLLNLHSTGDMEGSNSEAIYQSLDLKPQLFINEALNRVDELLDGAFDFFHQEASTLLKTDGTDRSDDLKMGINYVRQKVQGVLDKRLTMWEQYCLHHCFLVPDGFSIPSLSEQSADDRMDQDDTSDDQVEAQLDLLRTKLTEAEKENAELNQELQELERKAALSNECASSVNNALQLYETSSAHEMFKEMSRVASELCQKVELLKNKHNEEIKTDWKDKAYDANDYLSVSNLNKGLPSLDVDELQGFITGTNL